MAWIGAGIIYEALIPDLSLCLFRVLTIETFIRRRSKCDFRVWDGHNFVSVFPIEHPLPIPKRFTQDAATVRQSAHCSPKTVIAKYTHVGYCLGFVFLVFWGFSNSMTRPGIQKDKYKHYGRRKTHLIQALYILAATLWIGLCYYLELYRTDWVGILILVLPLLVFLVSYSNADSLSIEIEEEMFRYDYLTIGLLIAFPLLTWMSKDYQGDKRHFIRVIVVAIMFTLLAIFDVWVKRKWVTVVKHTKSIFQTAAVALLIYAFYNYYVKKSTDVFS